MPLPPWVAMSQSHDRSCFWALYCSAREFASAKSEVQRGFAFARRIAEVAQERRERFADYPDIPQPVTAEDISDDEGISAAAVRRFITMARRYRFGEKPDRAIRRELRPKVHRRTCSECGAELPDRPAGTPGRPRRYCDDHATAAARKRISRAAILPAFAPKPPVVGEPETIRCALCGESGTVTDRAEGRAWWRNHRATCAGNVRAA